MAAYYCTDASVKVDGWRSLAVVDHGSNLPGPGLSTSTKDMPIVINPNLVTSLGKLMAEKRPPWILHLMNQPMFTRSMITQ